VYFKSQLSIQLFSFKCPIKWGYTYCGLLKFTPKFFSRAFLFGGVQDLEDDDDDDDEDASGQFFNELYSLQVDNDKASWQKSKNSLIQISIPY
jgi:hypothetical protein